DAAGLTPTLPKKTVRLYAPFVLPAYLRHPRARDVRRLLERAVFHDPRYADDAWVNTIVEQWKPRSRRAAFIATANALRPPATSRAPSRSPPILSAPACTPSSPEDRPPDPCRSSWTRRTARPGRRVCRHSPRPCPP